jgi:DNA replication and repair protein RecF
LGVKPLLLLDDIFDKLDQKRVKKLLALVSDEYFGQVMVTDTDLERLQTIFGGQDFPFHLFQVSDGKVQSIDISNSQTISI